MIEFLKDLQDVFNKHQKTLVPTENGIVISEHKEHQILATNDSITGIQPYYYLYIASQYC